MNAITQHICHYCDELQSNTRPYGPGGDWICESCAISTPARKAAALGAFHALLDVALIEAPGYAIAVDHCGPRPARLEDVDNPSAQIITLRARKGGDGSA